MQQDAQVVLINMVLLIELLIDVKLRVFAPSHHLTLVITLRSFIHFLEKKAHYDSSLDKFELALVVLSDEHAELWALLLI